MNKTELLNQVIRHAQNINVGGCIWIELQEQGIFFKEALLKRMLEWKKEDFIFWYQERY